MKFAIGIPTINRKDLLNESLEDIAKNMSDVEQIYLTDNGNQNIESIVPESIKYKTRVAHPPINMGVAGSWNDMMYRGFVKRNVDYMLILNDDVVFGRTTKELEEAINFHPEAFLLRSGGWGAFLISNECYQIVGPFDEKFFPAYFEDNDYSQRMYKIGRLDICPRGIGQLEPKIYRTSMSIKKDPNLNKNFKINSERFRGKWGGPPDKAKFSFPFNERPAPEVVVITRTSGRPNFFRQCYESIHEQDTPIKHIVIVDDYTPDHYINGYSDVTILKLNRDKFKPRGGGFYNNYLNYALCMLNPDDKFIILDDDDVFVGKDAVRGILGKLGDNDMAIWRVRAAGGTVPYPQYFKNKQIVQANIAMPGFMAKRSIVQDVYFDYNTIGDFRFITKANEKANNTIWIDRVLTSTNNVARQGKGFRKDAPYEAIHREYLQIQKTKCGR
jgi:GT2 family glycosyltransferase